MSMKKRLSFDDSSIAEAQQEAHVRGDDGGDSHVDGSSGGSSLAAVLRRDFFQSLHEDAKQPVSADESPDAILHNFLIVPYELESMLWYAMLICWERFFYALAILPIKVASSIVRFIWSRHLTSRELFYLLKVVIMVGALCALSFFGFSTTYHDVKRQSTIKLYVIYNALEIFDRVMCSLGTDVFRGLLATSHAVVHRDGKISSLLFYTLGAFVYVSLHSTVLFFQLVTLNVAINFSNNSLVTVLLSNNFLEIKSRIFKRFSAEQLFQLSCADSVERTQLSIYLLLIMLHNFSDLHWEVGEYWPALVKTMMTILGVEVLVDWVKHGFICKFNRLSAHWYRRGRVVLLRDALGNEQEQAASRIGFMNAPLAVLAIKMMWRIIPFDSNSYFNAANISVVLIILVNLALIRYTLYINLLGISRRLWRYRVEEKRKSSPPQRARMRKKSSTRDLNSSLKRFDLVSIESRSELNN